MDKLAATMIGFIVGAVLVFFVGMLVIRAIGYSDIEAQRPKSIYIQQLDKD